MTNNVLLLLFICIKLVYLYFDLSSYNFSKIIGWILIDKKVRCISESKCECEFEQSDWY